MDLLTCCYSVIIVLFSNNLDFNVAQTQDNFERFRKTTIKCSEHQFTCENGIECVNYIDVCNFKSDCSDQSDERKSTCAIHNETSCYLPEQTPDKSFALNCKDGITKRKQIQGDRVGPFATLTFTCNPGYTREEDSNMFHSYCLNGRWSPMIPECKRICERLLPINLDLECFRNDHKIDCNGPLLSGTTVHAKCKNQYAPRNAKSYERITCNENGQWNKLLPECELECGKIQENETDTQRLGNSNNYNYFPWHVAIYDVRNIPTLIRSGTIISPILILTVTNSIYDEITPGKVDPKYFQVVVGKVTANYFVQDNEFQKSYEVIHIYSGHYDFAIFELKERISFSFAVIPACIGMSMEDENSYFVSEKVNAKVASWGITNYNNVDENTFRIDEYEISAYHRCAYESDKFCGRLIYGAGTNISDVGAGLIYKNNDGKYYAIGVMNKKYRNEEHQYSIIATNLEPHFDNWIDTIYQRTENQRVLQEGKSNFRTKPECEYGTFFNPLEQRASVCLKKNSIAMIPPCKKICHKVQPNPHMKLNCTFNDIYIDCDDELVEGSKITMECDKGYKPLNSPNYQHITCQNGKWSHEIFTCVESTLKSCVLPPQTKDKNYAVNCKTDHEKNTESGIYSVEEFTMLSFECKPGYFRKGGNSFQSICLNGTWSPEIENCTPFCKTFLGLNLSPECYYDNEKIDCNQPLKPGTRIRPYCERHYHKKYTEFEEIVCQEDGNWDRVPIECIHPCGSEVTKEIDRHFDFRMTSVLISIVDKKTKSRICSGTILTPYLILTTARCFFNPELLRMNPATDYEIVTGKKTGLIPSFPTDFLKLMTDNRKTYQVQKIYYTNKGKNRIVANCSEDLALLETVEKIQFNPNTYPACVNWDHLEKFDVTPYFSFQNEENSNATAAEVAKLEKDYFQHDGSYIGSDIRFRYYRHYPFEVCRQYLKNEKENKPDMMCMIKTDMRTHRSLVLKDSRLHTKTKKRLLVEISQMQDEMHPIFQFTLYDGDFGVGYLQKKNADGNTYVQGIFSERTLNSSAILMINLNYHSQWLKRVKQYVDKRRVLQETQANFHTQHYNYLEANRFDGESFQNFTYQSIEFFCERNLVKRQFIGGCFLPNSTYHNIDYEVFCPLHEFSSYCSSIKDNFPVPESTRLKYKCKPGYALIDKQEQESFCRDSWHSPIRICKRQCRRLKPVNVKLQCMYEGRPIDCNGHLVENTIVIPKCLQEYEPETPPGYRELKCGADGEWNYYLYSCRPKCGRAAQGKVTPLIKGGNEAQIGEFPWHVAIFDKFYQYPLICGGTIISPYVIVSAAHCFYDKLNQTTRPSQNFEIAVAKFTRSYDKKDSEATKFYEIENIIVENYRGYATRFQYDIALLQTKNKIEFNYLVTPICLNYDQSNFRIPTNELLKVCGWGLDDENRASEKLRVTQLPFFGVNECFTKAPSAITEFISVDKFCVGSFNGSIVERGDSGGGLSFVDNTTTLHLHYLVGIVSTKPPGLPTVAMVTDVNQYIPWILKHMTEIHKIKQYEDTLNNNRDLST